MAMTDFEKLGVFYLGRPVDPATGEKVEAPYLLDASDLTTHAMCMGMTGSGKTGLGIALIEEAAIDGIPSIVIDPKGDMGNLLLTFPELRPGDFEPWVDEGQARREGKSTAELADETSALWRKGLAKWGEDGDRIRRLRGAADFAIYTPGSPAGLELSILSAMEPPPEAVRVDATALREAVDATVAGLLSLAGAGNDAQSPAYILLSALVAREWEGGRAVTLERLIPLVQEPGMDKLGVFPLETFFPAKERMKLAMKLNALVASPSMAAWGRGEPLDVQRLLYTPDGRPRVSVVSIAHLSEGERMFFVTLLLTSVVSWMRQQSGTSSLRALLYMDEIFGYFPPLGTPPSKKPMLTLLKQARAFGLGVVLSTQNPVDLDYRGLSNIGLWMIGRLQTERDKERVMEGLVGADAADGLDRAALGRLLGALGKRQFLVRNVHEGGVGEIESRWALSYLRGPLSPAQISQLMAEKKTAAPAIECNRMQSNAVESQTGVVEQPAAAPVPAPAPAKAPLVPGVDQVFFGAEGAEMSPWVLGEARVHYQSDKLGIDEWQTVLKLAPVDEDGTPDWDAAEDADGCGATRAPAGASFAGLPATLGNAKNWPGFARGYKEHLRQTLGVELATCPAVKLTARMGESEGDFRVRVGMALREARDAEKAKIAKKHESKVTTLTERIRKAEAKIEVQKEQASQSKMNTALKFGLAILSAITGSKGSAATRAAGGIGAMRKSSKEAMDVAHAQADKAAAEAQLADLQAKIDEELQAIAERFDPERAEIERTRLRPKVSELLVKRVALAWR